MESKKDDITKAPHYFRVTFEERHTSIKGPGMYGKAYVIVCDGVPVNVYGFDSEAEAKAFDPLKLRSFLIGVRHQRILWDAPDKETLLKEIEEDPRVKSGVFKLSEHSVYGNIEDLPECPRMYLNSEGSLLCGTRENSCGGCVLQGFDQEEEFYDGSKCPMYAYWDNLSEKRQSAMQ